LAGIAEGWEEVKKASRRDVKKFIREKVDRTLI
jgi:hypothetical protein